MSTLAALIIACNPAPPTPSVPPKDLSATKDFQAENLEIFLRVFKQEQEFELWTKTREASTWTLQKTYTICQSSGDPGPKRRQGDFQVPEGVYYIDRFNPNSSYHLSLGLNYPNASDLVRGDPEKPGGDIFIHGACVTIGCIPLTDVMIEEVYKMAELAKADGQAKIPVHIFPARMEEGFFEAYASQSGHVDFWRELQPIYAYFEANHQLPKVRILADGRYQLTSD